MSKYGGHFPQFFHYEVTDYFFRFFYLSLSLLSNTEIYNPIANAPWSTAIPAFTSNTEIRINVQGFDGDGNLLFWKVVTTRTVKNTNVSGIVFNLGDITAD